MHPLAKVAQVFAARPKPAQLTVPGPFPEYIEFGEMLAAYTPGTISFKELGNILWNPISFATDDAFLHYIPALARLATGKGSEYFVDQLLSHMGARRLTLFRAEEREALKDFLLWLQHDMRTEIEENLDEERVAWFIQALG